MENLSNEIKVLNKDVLNPKKLNLISVYDETIYINNALSLVKQNIIIGGFLAICVLIIFFKKYYTYTYYYV